MICEAVTEGRIIAEKTTGRASAPSSAPAAPVARNATERAEFELQQEAARKAATEAQAARDARVASAGEATPEA